MKITRRHFYSDPLGAHYLGMARAFGIAEKLARAEGISDRGLKILQRLKYAQATEAVRCARRNSVGEIPRL